MKHEKQIVEVVSWICSIIILIITVIILGEIL